MSLLVPIAAGLGLLLLLSGGGDDDAPAAGPPGPGGGPPPPPPGPGGGTIPKPPTPNTETPPGGLYAHCYDPGIPDVARNQVETALSMITEPAALDTIAAALAASGYPMAAACVKQKADKLRSRGVGGINLPLPTVPIDPPPGGGDMPYALGFGDYPYGLANYYTGQGGRFRELDALNPQLGTFGGGKYPNWDSMASSGQSILLPASWDPWEKQLPTKGMHPYQPSGVMPS